MKADFHQRLDRARAALGEAGCDALLLAPGADLSFLTGFDVHIGERLLALVLPAEGEPCWITPEMNAAQIRDHGVAAERVLTWDDADGPAAAARNALLGVGAVAADEEMRAGFALDLMEWLPDLRLRRAGAVMGALRLRKEPDEVAALRASGKIVDRVISDVRAACRPGRAEREVAAEIRAALDTASPGFEPWGVTVASGPNGALPHHSTGERELLAGDLVVVDFGGYPGGHLHGYVSDITVTLALGEPPAEAREVYAAVLEAQQRAIDAVRPGARCCDIDAAARQSLERAGYGEYFIHRVGHGVGLDVHEPPYLTATNEAPLEEGFCFSVEPGVYLPGRFGVRLEVLATVTSDGVSLLNTPSSPELPVLET